MFSNRIPVISEQPQLDQKVRGVFSNSSPRDRPSEEYFEQGKDYLAQKLPDEQDARVSETITKHSILSFLFLFPLKNRVKIAEYNEYRSFLKCN